MNRTTSSGSRSSGRQRPEETGWRPNNMAKMVMSKEEQLSYVVPAYLLRLKQARYLNQIALNEGNGEAGETDERIQTFSQLISMIENNLLHDAAELAYQEGIINSFLQG